MSVFAPALVLALAAAPASAADTFDGLAYRYGDLHVHTGASGDGEASDVDGCASDCGSLSLLRETAEDNGLDFMAVTDHVNGNPAATPENWQRSLDALLDADDPDHGFVAVPGAEVFFMGPDGHKFGHKNALFFGDDAMLADLTEAALQPTGDTNPAVADCDAIWAFGDALQAEFGPVLLIPHHPASTAPMPTDWSCFSAAYEPAVEGYSNHGDSFDPASGYDPLLSTTASGAVSAAIDPAQYGLRMGFVGGTDSHDTMPGSVCHYDPGWSAPYAGGLTVAVTDAASTFDRTALYDAIVAHHTYETSGPRVPVAVSYLSDGARLAGLGDTVALPDGQELIVEVAVPAEWAPFVASVTLEEPGGASAMTSVGSGEWRIEIPASTAPAYVFPELLLDGSSIYGSAGCDDGGVDAWERVWISPSWIESGPGDVDGDGYSEAAGDCDDGDAAVHPGATEICDDGVDDDCDGLVDGADPDCLPPRPTVIGLHGPPVAPSTPAATGTVDVRPPDRPHHGCASAVDAPSSIVAVAILAARRRRRPRASR